MDREKIVRIIREVIKEELGFAEKLAFPTNELSLGPEIRTVTGRLVEEWVEEGIRRVIAPRTAIITPAARDLAREKGIEVVREEE